MTKVYETIGADTRLQAILSNGAFIPVDMSLDASTPIVGVEVELENTVPISFEKGYWNTTRDGSLRNNGYEYVSLPFSVDCIDKVMKELKDNLPSSAEANGRCGLHVHVNVLDLTITQLQAFLKNVYDLENNLFHASGDRINNYHCAPWHGSSSEVMLLKFIKDKITLKTLLKHCKKYSGINILPIAQHGTVEFRMHKGTKDTVEISEWVKHLANIRSEAIKGVA